MSAIVVARRITAKAVRAPQQSAFSTTTLRRAGDTGPEKKKANANKPDDVEIPAFNLGHITSSPRVKFWLISGFGVVAAFEMYGWYNFGPKVLGWEKEK